MANFYNTWQVSLGNVFNFLLSGNDTVNGSTGNDSLFGGAGNDTISGFAGDDYIEPGRGTDTVAGGDGTRDILSYANANGDATVTKGVTVDLTKATVTDAWGDTDSFSGIEGVRGTNAGVPSSSTVVNLQLRHQTAIHGGQLRFVVEIGHAADAAHQDGGAAVAGIVDQ